MATVAVRDDAIWIKHIEGDPVLRARIGEMAAGDTIDLEVDGVVGRWERMRDGKDGRPTFGIKPVEAMRLVWADFRRSDRHTVHVREVRNADSYLKAVAATLSEWNSAEDEIAYRDL